jgi:hypothetical protein
VPTVFWLNSGDAFLKAVCVCGAVLALMSFAGYAHRLILIALFYLTRAGNRVANQNANTR